MTRMFEVTWEGPFTFTDILTSPEIRQKYSCSGVYLWKEVDGECEQIAYIGKASGAPTLFSDTSSIIWATLEAHILYLQNFVHRTPRGPWTRTTPS